MIIEKKEWDFLNLALSYVDVKQDKPICFYNKDGFLAVSYIGSIQISNIETAIPWDLTENKLYFYYKNLSFLSSGVLVRSDFPYIYFSDESTLITIKCLDEYFDIVDFVNEDTNKIVFEKEDFTALCSKFSILFKSLDPSSELGGFYIDANNMFSTDRIGSSWIKGKTFISDSSQIVVSNQIINALLKYKQTENSVEIYYNSFLFGFKISTGNCFFTFHQRVLNIRYPDFERVFNKFVFDSSLMMKQSELKEELDKMLKFDNKISYVTFTVDEGIIKLSAVSTLSGGSIISHIEAMGEQGDNAVTYKKTAINIPLNNFNKLISDMEDYVVMYYNSEQMMPVKFTDSFNIVERYLVTYGGR